MKVSPEKKEGLRKRSTLHQRNKKDKHRHFVRGRLYISAGLRGSQRKRSLPEGEAGVGLRKRKAPYRVFSGGENWNKACHPERNR